MPFVSYGDHQKALEFLGDPRQGVGITGGARACLAGCTCQMCSIERLLPPAPAIDYDKLAQLIVDKLPVEMLVERMLKRFLETPLR